MMASKAGTAKGFSLWAMMERRRTVLIAVFAVALVALPFILHAIKPTYVGTAHVMMVGKDSMIPSTDMGTLTMSEAVVQNVAKRFGIASVDTLRGRISAKPGLHSNVMPISYRDKDAKRARDVTNALADETAAYYKTLTGGQYDQMIAFLRQSLRDSSNEISTIDAQLQKAAQRDSFAGSDKSLDQITDRLATLDSDRGKAYSTYVADQAVAAAQSAQPKETRGIVEHEVLASDPLVAALRANQARDAANLELQRSQFTSKYPGLPGLTEQVQHEDHAVDAAIAAAVSGQPSSSPTYAATVLAKRNADALVAGDRARLAAIDKQIQTEQAHLRDIPVNGAEAGLLRSKRDAAQAAYAAAVLKLNDTQAAQAAASSLGAVVVIDHAADAPAHIPRLALDIIVAFLLVALTLSIGFLVDLLDPALRSPAAVEKLYGVPVVGNLGSR